MSDVKIESSEVVVQALHRRSNEPFPFSSDVVEVGRELERAKGKGVFTGYLLLWRIRFEAWLEEKVKRQIVRKLSTRKHIAEMQLETVEAETKLKASLYSEHIEEQQQATALSLAKQQRLMTDLATFVSKGEAVASGVLPSSAEPMVSVHVTDDQIEALALRAVLQLGPDDGTGDAAWDTYKKELFRQLPVNVAKEVERRILELRSILK